METYQNLCTQFYELDKPEAPHDALQFYMTFAEQAKGRIFEPMCGTGRFLIPMLEKGLLIEGADASPQMLGVCRSKCLNKGLRATLHQQYLHEMAFDYRFKLIFIPSGSFGLVTDAADAAR